MIFSFYPISAKDRLENIVSLVFFGQIGVSGLVLCITVYRMTNVSNTYTNIHIRRPFHNRISFAAHV